MGGLDDGESSPARFRRGWKKGLQSIGRNRAGLTTKFHLALTPQGFHSFVLSPGNTHDCVAIQNLWGFWDWSKIFMVIADRGYDTNNIRALIAACGAASVIPGRSNRKEPIPYDRKLYSTRRNIEITFGKLKENKRVNARFDKLDVTFAAFFALAFIKLLVC